MDDFLDSHREARAERPRQQSNLLWWILGAGAVGMLICCGGGIGGLAYLGTYAPDTAVYTGNRIPADFLSTVKSVGALDDDEKILFFYSDAITDIRDGFYFVSDQKVVIYAQQKGDSALNKISFDQIADHDLYRDESFFEDSEITLRLKDGQVLSFPVSSEHDRDQKFFDAIVERVEAVSDKE